MNYTGEKNNMSCSNPIILHDQLVPKIKTWVIYFIYSVNSVNVYT